MANLLLIDVNILGIGSMHEYEFKGLTHRGKDTGAIHGTIRKLSGLLETDRDTAPIVLWDDRCRWREDILPQYKRHRWETPEQRAFLESYLAQAEVITALLGHLGIPQISCPNFEADDIAGLICRHIDPSWKITLATTDTDWYQALQTNVVWKSTRSGAVVTEADLANTDIVKDGPFLSTDHYIQAKALAGDSSDGIPSVKGVGIKTAAKIIKEFGTIEALWAKHDAGEALKGVVLQRTAGAEYRKVYYRNLKLIDWRLAPSLGKDFRLTHEPRDIDAFRQLCAMWGLDEVSESRESIAAPRQSTSPAVKGIRTILEAVSSGNA